MSVLTPAPQFLTNWTPGTHTGVPGGISRFMAGGANERPDSGIDVLAAPYNCDPAGIVDSHTGLAFAIAATAPGEALVLPEAIFKFTAGLHIPSYISVRGQARYTDGSFKTKLRGPGLSMGAGGAQMQNEVAITAGLSKDSAVISVTSTSALTAGELVQLRFSDMTDDDAIQAGAEPVLHTYGLERSRVQMSRIQSVDSSTQLTLSTPIIHNIEAGSTASLFRVTDRGDFIGIEDLEIDGTGYSMFAGVAAAYCYGSWLKGVAIRNTSNYHATLYGCLRCEVVTCIFDTRVGAGTNGAGLLVNASTSCLAENCQINDIFPGIEVNQGSSGNVFAYSFLDGQLTGINTNHGPHNSFNLYEGNITPWMQPDGYFGGASRDTLWRNWITGTTMAGDLGQTIPIGLNRFTRYYQIGGNLLANAAWPYGVAPYNYRPYSFGNPNIGNGDSAGISSMLAGDFPLDWKMQVTLTTRISDYEALLTIDSGSCFFRGGSTNAPAQGLYIRNVTGADPTVIAQVFNVGINTAGNIALGTSGDTVLAIIDRLCFIEATKDPAGNLVGSWSTPKQLSSHGAIADQHQLQAQFSTDGSSWHFGFEPGDTHMRVRADTGAYSAAKSISGETSGGGNYTDYRFQWNYGTANFYETPAADVNEPEGWHNVPPTRTGKVFAAVATVFPYVFPGPEGFQELDEDVEGTTNLLGNAHMHLGGAIPVDEAVPVGDVLKPSLYRESAPSWWNTGIFPWPPFESTAPVASYSALPAGADFLANVPPELLDVKLEPDGLTVKLTFNKQVTYNAAADGRLAVSYSGTTLTFASGSGSTQLSFTASRVILDEEVGTLDFAETINGIEDLSGVDLPPFTGATIGNFSTQTGAFVWHDAFTLAEATGVQQYPFAGAAHIQAVTVPAASTLVKIRIHIDAVGLNPLGIKVAVARASDRVVISSGTGLLESHQAGNYKIVSVSSVAIPAGVYLLAWQFDANSEPDISAKTGMPSGTSELDAGTSYAAFPGATLGNEGGLTVGFVAGLRVLPDVSVPAIPALRSALAPRYTIPRT